MTQCIHCDATVLSATHSGEALRDMQTHYASWRRALQLARAMAAPSGVDHDDAAFWDHEMAAFDSATQSGFAPRSRAFAAVTPAVGGEREMIANRAREWAGHYKPHSDGWNTFICFAEWVESLPAAQPAYPLRVQETCLECGTCDPCDDDCPNYIEANLPTSPLRGREITADELAKFIHNYDRFLATYIAKNLLVHFSIYPKLELASTTFASPPEQPATPATVKILVDAIDAKNARIAQLEEALGKAVLQPAPVWNDPADVWEAYCAETPTKRRSPQGALAFGFHAALATATDQETT